MYFCPFCGTLLQLAKEDQFQYYCGTCPYVVPVIQPLTRVHSFLDQNKRADQEDAFVGSSNAAAEGGQMTTIRCASGSECESSKAYFIQLQMRSADEPPTTFFKCCECGFQWKSD